MTERKGRFSQFITQTLNPDTVQDIELGSVGKRKMTTKINALGRVTAKALAPGQEKSLLKSQSSHFPVRLRHRPTEPPFPHLRNVCAVWPIGSPGVITVRELFTEGRA